MNVYMYQAALFCEDCGVEIRARLTKQGTAPEDPEDEYTYDSDDYPKGPYSDGGGESDCPNHCDGCEVFLENPLTDDGYDSVSDIVKANLRDGRADSIAVTVWAPFYDIEPELEAEEDGDAI